MSENDLEMHLDGEDQPGLGGTLRLAAGTGLSLGLGFGLVDALAAALARGDAPRLEGLAAAVALDGLALALVLLLIALPGHFVLRASALRVRLWAFAGVGTSLALVAGHLAWRVDVASWWEQGLVAFGSVLVGATLGWGLARMDRRVHVITRLVALVVCLAGAWTLRAHDASAVAASAGEPGGMGTRHVALLVVPGLEAQEVVRLPRLSRLAERGALVSTLRVELGPQPVLLATLLSGGSTSGDSQGPPALNSLLADFTLGEFPGDSVIDALGLWESASWWRRFSSGLVLRRLERAVEQLRGDGPMLARAGDWLVANADRPAWVTVELRAEDGAARADAAIGEFLGGLADAGLSEDTLVLIIGSPRSLGEGASAKVAPLVLANTRLVPHGKRLAIQASLEDVLPTVAELMGRSCEPCVGSSFAAAIVGRERGQGGE